MTPGDRIEENRMPLPRKGAAKIKNARTCIRWPRKGYLIRTLPRKKIEVKLLNGEVITDKAHFWRLG